MKLRRWQARGMLSGVALAAILPLCGASLSAAAVDSAIAQGFVITSEAPAGTLVSYTDEVKNESAEPANTENSSRLVGVVVEAPLIQLSDGVSQKQVAISGSTFALVSTINGEVKRGDKIAPSPISGVGMKATKSTEVVGIAEQDFTDAKQVSERTVTDVKGQQATVKIGLVQTQVNVSYYQAPDEEWSFLPSFLLQFAKSIAGRDVAPIRVIAAMVLMLAGFGGIAILLYASVRSSIISIGRNPLSEQAVRKSLLEVVGLALGILLVTLIAVYLVLIL